MNLNTPRLALVALASLAPLAGCATVTPPPPVMALEGASRGAAGGTSVTAFGGANAGVFLESALGGGARVAHRVSDEVSLGVEGVAGAVIDSNGDPASPRRLFAGRAHVQLNPGASEHLALTLGFGGGGANNDLGYVTADVGARVSTRVARGVLEPYAGAVLAGSVPVSAPAEAVQRVEGGDHRYAATAYAGLDLGLVVRATERLDVAFDVLLLGGVSASNNALMATPTLGLRYNFGAPRAAR
ncbi:MAG: hypothetical protein U0324_11215 [Polyangiales bacterium]